MVVPVVLAGHRDPASQEICANVMQWAVRGVDTCNSEVTGASLVPGFTHRALLTQARSQCADADPCRQPNTS